MNQEAPVQSHVSQETQAQLVRDALKKIRAGESQETVLMGLPEDLRKKVEEELNREETNKESNKAIGEVELKSYNEENAQVIEGKFDGYFMMGSDQKKYPVPLNYSSKTKLVAGDILKLKILEDGKFIYKLIQPVERKHIRAIISQT